MDKFQLVLSSDELPNPGEMAEFEVDGYIVVVENANPQAAAGNSDQDIPEPGDVVKYVPVDITAPTSVVRHAAKVFQRHKRTRVDRWTLCDRSRAREVKRRRDGEPLTNVTCAQCRHALIAEGLLDS